MIFVIFIDNGLVKDKLDNSARVALYRDVISAAAKRERCLGSGAEDIRRDGDFFFFRHSRARTVQIDARDIDTQLRRREDINYTLQYIAEHASLLRRDSQNLSEGTNAAVLKTADTALFAHRADAVAADIGANGIDTAGAGVAGFHHTNIATAVPAHSIAVVAGLKAGIDKAIAAIISGNSFGFTSCVAPVAGDAVF